MVKDTIETSQHGHRGSIQNNISSSSDDSGEYQPLLSSATTSSINHDR